MNAVLKRSVLTSLALTSLVLVGGCVSPHAFDTSPGHISQPTQPATPIAPPPAPVKAAPALAPPRPSAPVPTYTVVVNDVPVKDLLFSIARDTQYNIDLYPGISGNVSLNAVQEPLPAILDRIARQANLRYEMNGRTVSIMPDTPYVKTYKVNYVNVVTQYCFEHWRCFTNRRDRFQRYLADRWSHIRRQQCRQQFQHQRHHHLQQRLLGGA